MRRALPLLLLAACGPSRPDPALPRYGVVTTLPPDSPLDREIARLAEYRRAPVFRVPSLAPRRAVGLLDWLRDNEFSYVAFVAPPEHLDPPAFRTLASLACDVDGDPFPDFAWGVLLATDVLLLRRQIDALVGAEAKVEKRLLRATRLACGAAASAAADRSFDWAASLPVRSLEAREGDASFLDRCVTDLERCDHLLLSGEPAAGGIRGLPADFLRRLRLDSSAVFCGPGWTGDPARPFLSALLRSGAVAVFAPVTDSAPGRVEAEWAEAVLSDLPAGDVAKRVLDTAVLAGDPDLRVLFGDPMIDVWTRSSRPALLEVHSRPDPIARTLESAWRVVSGDPASLFADPRGGERVHLRIPLSGSVRGCRLLEARAGDAPVEASGGTLERWRGSTFAHVLLRAPRLSREGLVLTVRLELR